jgi:outer membrane protein TolC
MAVLVGCLGMAALTSGSARATGADTTTPLAKATAQLVADALQANQGLLAERAVVARRLAELDRARARYLPSLDFQSRYTRADGGRTIEFPLGDLLNPVYAALDAQLDGTRDRCAAHLVDALGGAQQAEEDRRKRTFFTFFR